MKNQVQYNSLLIGLLREPSDVNSYDVKDWELLIREARQEDMLATVYCILRNRELISFIPPAAMRHFESMWNVSQATKADAIWEVAQIYKALSSFEEVPILLKGAAYLYSNIQDLDGRIFQDVDILVPKALINDIERALFLSGWSNAGLDEYDQRYYRKWMHELPPMEHVKRGTVVDVHHNILPITAKYSPEAVKLIQAAHEIRVDSHLTVWTLSPCDMIIHSATHLFHEGEFEHGLRDIYDLHCLLKSAWDVDGFWKILLDRSAELGLALPLYYALRYCRLIIGTSVPEDVITNLGTLASIKNRIDWMDMLYFRVLGPSHPSATMKCRNIAEYLLYIRSHYLRMPIWMLIPHLMRKLFSKNGEEELEGENEKNRLN